MTTSDDATSGVTRRDVIVAAAVGGVALALPGGARGAEGATEGATATGLVFESRGGQHKGVAGVMVSNGREIVVTDADGRYTLPVGDESVIFVVKPAGYMTPVDPITQLPLFYRLHQPGGSPASLGLTFPGIAPTGALPASVDFELLAQDEPKAFEVILVTDPQPESDAEIDFIREDLVEALDGTTARFGLTAGDIMFDDLSLYDRLNRIFGTFGLPWYTIGGNHDLNFEAPGRRYSRETYKRVFGPPYYAFAYADVVFIMLDNVEYLGARAVAPGTTAHYQGSLDPDQLTFVGNLLAHVPDDKLVVVVMHIPLRNVIDPATPDNNLINARDLFKLFEGRRHTLSLAGHTHTTEHHYFGAADGWPGPVPHHHHVMTALSGSWWSGPCDHRGVAVADSRDGSPNGFHILAVDGNGYTTRFVPVKEPDGRQVRLSIESHAHGESREVLRDFRPGQLLQSPIGLATVPAATIVANVFDGGPNTIVTLQVAGMTPVTMTRKLRPDPFVGELFARNEAVKKPWVKAEVSSHIWVAKLPPALPAGTHRVTVIAINEYGVRVRGSLALEVVG